MKFAELVKERTNGRITIDVFPSAQLGEEKAVIEQVQLGAIEFTRVSTGPMAEFNKDFGVFSLPYIFDSDEHVWNFLLSDTGMELLDTLQSSGLQGLAYYSSGSRSFYSARPLTKLEDLKGLKIRVQENKINIALIEALGASATPMPYGEVYSSLQTGVIDAAENNFPSYYSSKHYEVAPHYLLDGHQRVPEVLVVSKSVWDKLSGEDRDIIRQAAMDSVAYQREEWAKYEKESEEAVRAGGATITEVTDPQPWRDAVRPVIDSYRAEFSAILDAIDAAR
jgi:tripartite ATP-independent transporter DctP family solute receptor